jgi:Resolvase, N terminal domain
VKRNNQTNGAPIAKKAVAYARVSTKEQEKEGFSIDAQKKLLAGYAQANGLIIAKEFVEHRDREAERPNPLRRDDPPPKEASRHPRHPGRKDRPTLPESKGLGDTRRVRH